MNSKNSSKFQSVLKPALPVEEYLQDHLRRGGGGREVRDLQSLRVLLPSSQTHQLDRESPVTQVKSGMSHSKGVLLQSTLQKSFLLQL